MTINNPVNFSNNILGEKDQENDLYEVLQRKMTRDRDLERVEKNLPSLKECIEECERRGIKHIVELGSGEGILADDIQNNYPIKIHRIDKYNPSNKDSMPRGGRSIARMDINHFEHFPSNVEALYSIFTLQYTKKAPEIIAEIHKKLKIGGIAYIQFPYYLWNKELLKQRNALNKKNGLRVKPEPDNQGNIRHIIFILEKSSNEQQIIVPEYCAEKGKDLATRDGEPICMIDGTKQQNRDLFYHYDIPTKITSPEIFPRHP